MSRSFIGRTSWEIPPLEDLRALVEFAQAGSIAGAAAASGAELLDRSVKPPRPNALGSGVLEQARDLLQRTEEISCVGRR